MHFICKHDSLKTFNLLSKVLKVNLMILVVKKNPKLESVVFVTKYHIKI